VCFVCARTSCFNLWKNQHFYMSATNYKALSFLWLHALRTHTPPHVPTNPRTHSPTNTLTNTTTHPCMRVHTRAQCICRWNWRVKSIACSLWSLKLYTYHKDAHTHMCVCVWLHVVVCVFACVCVSQRICKADEVDQSIKWLTTFKNQVCLRNSNMNFSMNYVLRKSVCDI